MVRLREKLTPEQRADFDLLALRFQLPPEETAKALFVAALEALKEETHYTWPLFLVQYHNPP
jgi:hypothetical protein